MDFHEFHECPLERVVARVRLSGLPSPTSPAAGTYILSESDLLPEREEDGIAGSTSRTCKASVNSTRFLGTHPLICMHVNRLCRRYKGTIYAQTPALEVI